MNYSIKKFNQNKLISNVILVVNPQKFKVFKKHVFKSNKIEYHEEILKNAKHDKKNFNKKIMISLLEEVGKCNFDFEVSEDEIKKSIEYYNKLIS